MRINMKSILILLICLAFVTLVAEPKQNGFHCDDQSIREPFLQLQISLPKLLTISIAIPVIAVIFVENICKTQKPIKSSINGYIIALMFGLLVNFLLVMSAKNLFGRLRPHAIQFCNANHYCSEGLNNRYVDVFECRNDNYSRLEMRNVRHSFYSGHASIGVYSGVYLILYLRSKLCPNSQLLKAFFSLIYMGIAITSLYPGFTQWHNYWHFASDVFTGYAIGLVLAILVFRLFTCDTPNQSKDTNNYIPLNTLLSTASVL